jgi:hypothetical protein
MTYSNPTTLYKWGTPSLAEQKVIALQAQVANLKLENLQISKKLKGKLKDGDKKDEKKDGKQTKNKKDASNKTKQKKDEAWKKVPPKAGEAKTKEQVGKRWNWCKHHQAWCIHTPQDCEVGKKLMAANQAQVNDESGSKAGQTILMPLSWHTWPARTWNDGSDRHGS